MRNVGISEKDIEISESPTHRRTNANAKRDKAAVSITRNE
jgi:hypothetical protein